MFFDVPEAGHKWRVVIKSVEFIRMLGGEERIGLLVSDSDYLRGLGAGWTAELHEADA